MSSGQKKCAEDEDDWDDFMRKTHITSQTNWQVYSVEARYAKEGHTKYNLEGGLLIQYVITKLHLDEIIDNGYVEAKEKEILKTLIAKYGNRI